MSRSAETKPVPDTREAILKVSSALLQTRGFNGFSYAHVAEALNIKTAAVHYHFPSKTDLGVALIHRFRDRYQRWMQVSEAQSPWEKLDGYINIFAHFLKDGQKACPAGVLLAEHAAVPDEMRHETRLMMNMIFGWLTSVLDQGRRTGDFVFAGPASDKAMLIGAGMQGALLLARGAEHDVFPAVVRQLRNELGGGNAPQGDAP